MNWTFQDKMNISKKSEHFKMKWTFQDEENQDEKNQDKENKWIKH